MAYQRAYVDIDLDAIRHNAWQIKNYIGSTLFMPVIKADGYGHGAVMIARALCDTADYFAVATHEEALEIRNAGILTPILILGYVSNDYYSDLQKENITQTVFTLDMAKKLSATGMKNGKKIKIHIKIDTGMSRLGFDTSDENLDIISHICALPGVLVEGIFTHLATADEEDLSFARLQLSRFEDFISRLEKRGISIPIKHALNSAGLINFPQYHLDMVRAGIITYGLYPSDFVNKDAVLLKPALSLKSHIASIKKIPAGTGISYGQTFTSARDMTVAAVSIGYADGYPRLLSGVGRVLIHGQYAPITGRVCMDQLIVDVSHIPGVTVDDKVTLIGVDGENAITAEEIAEKANTINYEIICQIGKRLPRNYMGGL